MLGNFPGKCHSTFASSLLFLSALPTSLPLEIFCFTSKVYCYFEAIGIKDKGETELALLEPVSKSFWGCWRQGGGGKKHGLLQSKMEKSEVGMLGFLDNPIEWEWGIHIYIYLRNRRKSELLCKMSDIYWNRSFIKSLLVLLCVCLFVFCLNSVNFLVPFQNEARFK